MTPLLLPVNGGENVHLMIAQKLHMQTTVMNCKRFLRLRETHGALRLPVFFFSFFSFFFFSWFCQPYLEYREIWSKNYFTDQQTANTIYGFRNSVPVLKIHDCYSDTQKSEQHFIPIEAIATRREQCWYKQPTSNSFETLKTVYTYSNCMMNQLLYCWKGF